MQPLPESRLLRFGVLRLHRLGTLRAGISAPLRFQIVGEALQDTHNQRVTVMAFVGFLQTTPYPRVHGPLSGINRSPVWWRTPRWQRADGAPIAYRIGPADLGGPAPVGCRPGLVPGPDRK